MSLSEKQQIIHDWWRALQPEGQTLPARYFPSFDRGHRARLRRAASLHDLGLEEAPHRLFDRLLGSQQADHGNSPSPLEVALPLIAGAVSHVRRDTAVSESLAKAIGHSVLNKDESPWVSGLRFQRLLGSRDQEDFYQQLRRILAQDKAPVNVAVLAQDILAWHVERGRRTNPAQTMYYRWARDYYLDRKALAP